MEMFLFIFFSVLSVLSALGVILFSRPTRALLSLIVTMISLAVLFLLLGAYFIAMIHLIVYAGAVLVLFLFVIMLQGTGAREVPFLKRFPLFHYGATLTGTLLFGGMLGFTLYRTPFKAALGVTSSAEVIGKTLFQEYLLPFELTSIVLLLGVFAAVALAKKEAE